MRSQKRSQSDKAFNKGYHAAMMGRSWNTCPYDSGVARQTWMSGWREGREDQWNGLNQMAQVQKLSNMN